MRKKKDTHSFDFRPLGLAIREAREKAGLSRNDLGDKVFYGERHIADIENIGKHPSFQLFHDLVTMFNISVDEYFYPAKNVEKNTARRQIDSSLDLLSDNELKIIQGTIDGILNSRENKSRLSLFLYRKFICYTVMKKPIVCNWTLQTIDFTF